MDCHELKNGRKLTLSFRPLGSNQLEKDTCYEHNTKSPLSVLTISCCCWFVLFMLNNFIITLSLFHFYNSINSALHCQYTYYHFSYCQFPEKYIKCKLSLYNKYSKSYHASKLSSASIHICIAPSR